jgi:hypothetical protein
VTAIVSSWFTKSLSKTVEKRTEAIPPRRTIRLETWLPLTILDRFGLYHRIMEDIVLSSLTLAPTQPSLTAKWIHFPASLSARADLTPTEFVRQTEALEKIAPLLERPN